MPVGKIRSEGSRNIVSALQRNQIQRLVAVGAVGVRDMWNDQTWLSKILLPIVVGKARLSEAQHQEALIVGSGLDYLIVRAPRLTNKEVKTEPAVGPNLTVGFSDTLSRASLALLLLNQAGPGARLSAVVTAKDSV